MDISRILYYGGFGLLGFTVLLTLIFIIKRPKYNPDAAAGSFSDQTQPLRNGFPTQKMTQTRATTPPPVPAETEVLPQTELLPEAAVLQATEKLAETDILLEAEQILQTERLAETELLPQGEVSAETELLPQTEKLSETEMLAPPQTELLGAAGGTELL